jgi:hypothetical protein
VKKLKNILLFGLVCLLMSCSTSYYLQPGLQLQNTDLIYKDGIPILSSFLPNSTVMISCYKNTNNELMMLVQVSNEDSLQRITFFPENILVIGVDRKKRQKELMVYNPTDYLNRMKRSHDRTKVAMAYNASVSAQRAGRSQSKTNTSARGSVNNSDGSSAKGSVKVSSQTTTFDGAKAEESLARSREEIRNISNELQDHYERTEQGLLKATTLFTSDIANGRVFVKFDKKYSEEIIVDVPVGTEIHRFAFKK